MLSYAYNPKYSEIIVNLEPSKTTRNRSDLVTCVYKAHLIKLIVGIKHTEYAYSSRIYRRISKEGPFSFMFDSNAEWPKGNVRTKQQIEAIFLLKYQGDKTIFSGNWQWHWWYMVLAEDTTLSLRLWWIVSAIKVFRLQLEKK